MATANLLQTSVSGGTQNALSLQGDGVFFPKASTTSRLALTLTTTDKGFIVYDTTDNNIYFWNGAAWESVPSSGDAGANGSVQYNDNGIVSGATNFVYDKATGLVSLASATITGALTVNGSGRFQAAGANWMEFGVNVLGSNQATGAYIRSVVTSAGNPTYSWTGDTDTGLFNDTANTIGFSTGGVERARFNSTGNLAFADGKGIDFSAKTPDGSGTVGSEVLDDYEEGTWTIGLTFGGGSTGITTAANTGRYTKIGRQVTVIGYLSLTSKGSSTGSVAITGLPFASPNIASSFSAISMRIENISYVGTPQGLQLIGTSKIELEKVSEAGTATALTDANFSNTSGIFLESTYFV